MMMVIIVGLSGCGKSPITGTTQDIPKVGIPAEQITWVEFRPEVKEALAANSLARVGEAGKMITVQAGGTVGGNKTFDNKVDIPSGAVPTNTFIEVEVVCVDGHGQCGSGIDFLPNMQFLSDVKVTLSWEMLDVDTLTVDDFEAYYSEDNGATWHQIDDLEIDYDSETISMWEDHFTRYAWGLSTRTVH